MSKNTAIKWNGKILRFNNKIIKTKEGDAFMSATGGTITTDGDYKLHTFSTPGDDTFTVTQLGLGTYGETIDILLIGGGGGSGKATAAGSATYPLQRARSGGAGGGEVYETFNRTVYVDDYSLTVGAGGYKGGSYTNPSYTNDGTNGLSSTFDNLSASGGYRTLHIQSYNEPSNLSGVGGNSGNGNLGDVGGGGDGGDASDITGGNGTTPTIISGTYGKGGNALEFADSNSSGGIGVNYGDGASGARSYINLDGGVSARDGGDGKQGVVVIRYRYK